MAASVANPGSFGHREMTALLNWHKFHIDKTAATALPITEYCPLSSVIRPLSSVFRPLSSVLSLPSSLFRPPSSVFRLPSSVFRPQRSAFCWSSKSFFIPLSATLRMESSSCFENVLSSPVAWSSTKRPWSVITRFMSTSALESSS
jgi:hypothetical protein